MLKAGPTTSHHDWGRLRTSGADFSIASPKNDLIATSSDAVWLTGAACFANHLWRGANVILCTRTTSKGKVDYHLTASGDLQPFEEVFCDYGEDYFAGREVGCSNECCSANENE